MSRKRYLLAVRDFALGEIVAEADMELSPSRLVSCFDILPTKNAGGSIYISGRVLPLFSLDDDIKLD